MNADWQFGFGSNPRLSAFICVFFFVREGA